LLKTEPLFSDIHRMKARAQGKIAAVHDFSQVQMGVTGT
jgi:hypothetical protein